MDISTKPRYNLSLVLQETGLKADTVRAWERRYGIPIPDRSAGGQRLYSDFDLQQIKWLCRKIDEGMRIGQAASYWHELVASGIDPLEGLAKTEKPLSFSLPMVDADSYRDNWIAASLAFDEESADRILSRAFALFPPETVCADMIIPGLKEIGERWQKGEISVQQEHFTSEIVSRKLQALISSAPGPSRSERIMLANPAGEQHTLILEMLTMLLKYRGWRVAYLGADVPNKELISTIEATGVNLVVLTAARLETSLALLDTLNLLSNEGIPAAFGGWIFSRTPELVERLPGFYLGDDLVESINTIEELAVKSPPPSARRMVRHKNEDLVSAVQENKEQIVNTLLDSYPAGKDVLDREEIYLSTHFLLADLAAALQLGDIDYLLPNLGWIKDLLDDRNRNNGKLADYYQSVSKSLLAVLGEAADPIIKFFDGYLLSLENKEVK